MSIRSQISIVDNKFKVGGEFGFEYPISEIAEVDTVAGYPHVRLTLGGSDFGGIFKGRFEVGQLWTGEIVFEKRDISLHLHKIQKP